MEPLPNLSDKLQDYGLYREYANHRRTYINWRSGRPRAASAELSHLDAAAAQRSAEDPYEFERWYPTPEKFQFFFTVAYWRAVTTLVGSLIFTVTSCIVLSGQSQWKPLVRWAEFIGAVVFVASAYLTYVELINLPAQQKSTRPMIYLFPHWPDVLQRVRYDSLVGTLVYLCGSVLFLVAVVAELCLPFTASGALAACAVHVPASLGGVAFFAGGLCELSHTWIHADTVEWLGASAGVLNTVGGLAFLLGAAAGLLWRAAHARLTVFIGIAYLVGSVLYTLSSLVLLKMWRSNDFGLTLLSQLNRALHAGRTVRVVPFGLPGAYNLRLRRQASAPEVPVFFVAAAAASQDAAEEAQQGEGQGARKMLDLRGVAFVTVMCWLLVALTMNLLIGALWRTHTRDIHVASLWRMNFVGVLAVSVLLVVHSTVTSVPKEQPYWFAMQATRSIVLLAAIAQTQALMAEFGAGYPFPGAPPADALEL